MTLPKGDDKNSNEKLEPSRDRKVARTIGIILLIFSVLVFIGTVAAGSAAASFFSIILIIISLIIIRVAVGLKKNERQKIKRNKISGSKAKHALVLFLYFLAALAFCYSLYETYWRGAGDLLMGSTFIALILAYEGGTLDERFGTNHWLQGTFSNRERK
jgi:uncharacterized membrane protein